MGLCKHCRKVTSLFCYEHKVNVCEKCMVDNHQTCVVQTYLKWLEDCDFDPKCRTCGDAFDNGAEVIRLPCLHLMHLGCLDQYAKSFPSNTAPAGYTCPICTTGVVPPRNQAGPVADSARIQLSRLAWSRIPARTISQIVDQQQTETQVNQQQEQQQQEQQQQHQHQQRSPQHNHQQQEPAQDQIVDSIVVDSPKTTETHSTTFSASENVSTKRAVSVSIADAIVDDSVRVDIPQDIAPPVVDADDEKYARRPVNTRIARLVTNQLEQAGHFAQSAANDTEIMGGLKKTWIIVILLMMAAIAFLEAYTKKAPYSQNGEIEAHHHIGDIH